VRKLGREPFAVHGHSFEPDGRLGPLLVFAFQEALHITTARSPILEVFHAFGFVPEGRGGKFVSKAMRKGTEIAIFLAFATPAPTRLFRGRGQSGPAITYTVKRSSRR
jgi:hypothetical protein